MGILDGLLGSIGSIASSAIGAVGGFLGQEQANRSNRQIAEQNTQFNAEQAALQRQWAHDEAIHERNFQIQMSNTAYGRAIEDMKRSGLNPMLAYTQGGASTPGGANPSGQAATAVQPAPMQNKLVAAAQAAQAVAGVQATQAQAEKTQAETRNVEVDTARRELELPHSREYVVEKQMKELVKLASEAKISQWDVYLVEKYLRLMPEQKAKMKEEIKSTKALRVIRELDQVEAKANADYFRDVGKGGIYWREGRAAAGTILGVTAAGRAAKAAKALGQGLRPALRFRAYGR